MSNVTMIKRSDKKNHNRVLKIAENCKEDYKALEDALNDDWFLTDVICVVGTPGYHSAATVFILYKD